MTNGPKILAVSGGTGSGKTTLSLQIKKALGGKCIVIHEDSYYVQTDIAGQVAFGNIDFDSPQAIDHELLIEHLFHLKNGKQIESPIYDKKLHERKPETITIKPADIIIIEGLFVLFTEQIRGIANYKAFLDVSADIRLGRRLIRDVIKFGVPLEEAVRYYFEHARKGHKLFVQPTSSHADEDLIFVSKDPSNSTFKLFKKALLTKIDNR